MNPKNTLLLLALAGGLFAFIFFFERNQKAPAPVVLKVLPGLRPSAIHSIRVLQSHSKAEEIRVERTDDGRWRMTKPLVYPAETVAVNRLLLELMQLKPQLHLSSGDLRGRHIDQEYGFDSPSFRIIFDDDRPILNLGRMTAPGDQIYAQVLGLEGADGVDLVAGKLLTYVPREANDWRDSQFVDLKGLNFDRLSVAGPAGKFELQREATNRLWRISKPDVARADNLKIAGLLTNLQMLGIAHFQTDAPNADLEPFGLKPPVLELAFGLGTNRLFSLQFGKSPTNDPTLIFAKREGEPAVVLVPIDKLAGWNDGAKVFRDHRLARFEAAEPDLIECRGATNSLVFKVRRLTNDSWQVTAPFDCPADTNTMKAFLRNLAGLEVVPNDGNAAVQDVVAESALPDFGLAPPARQYFVKRTPDAVATNAVIAEIDFGAEKDGRVYARRGDLPEERSVYAVSLTNFNALPASAIQLRERRIWNFTGDQVTGITLRIDGKATEMAHKGAKLWSIPEGAQGIIPNDSQFIEIGTGELGELEAENWVVRGGDTGQFGFTDRSLQFIVKLKGRELQPLTLEFGGNSPRGLRYGKTKLPDGEVWVFEAFAGTTERLKAYFNIQEPGPH